MKFSWRVFILVVLVAISAHFLAGWVPMLGDIPVGILLGLVVGQVVSFEANSFKGLKWCEVQLLNIAILLIGLSLKFDAFLQLGTKVLVVLVTMIPTMLFFAWALSKVTKTQFHSLILLSVGNAICGSSAIAATSSIITPEDKFYVVGPAIAVVNLLGILGLFGYPYLIQFLGLDDGMSSLLIGGGLQAVGHVAAASASLSPKIEELSMLIKMGRVTLLVPTLLILSFLINNKRSKSKSKNEIKKFKNIFLVLPWYLYGFLIMAIIGQLPFISETVDFYVKKLSHYLLLFAMTALGLRMNFRALLKEGILFLGWGSLIFTVQTCYILLCLKLLF